MIKGELIVDNFAGGGGASTGIELATGYSVDIAINHDPEAIKMHRANHLFFVKYFSPKRASEFPVFVKGISLLSAGHSYASRRMRACSIR